MLSRRDKPFVSVSWIKRLLAGENSCEFAAWFKAHFQGYKKAKEFDNPGWQVDHAELVRATRKRLIDGGYRVFTENQNKFSLKRKQGTLGGRPDLIAVNGKSGLIVDAKTGTPQPSDKVQVMVYMWAVPQALTQFKDFKFDGKVVYKTREHILYNGYLDDTFVNNLRALLNRVCGPSPPDKIPSASECAFCDITDEDCPDRLEGEEEAGCDCDEELAF
jgi:hypothetical protein